MMTANGSTLDDESRSTQRDTRRAQRSLIVMRENHDLNVAVGKRLRTQRKKARLSRGDLADKIGCSNNRIKFLETDGIADPGLLILIARALGVPVASFFDGLEAEDRS